MAPGALSVTVTVNLTTAEHNPTSLVVTIMSGQTILGGSLSLTVTLKVTLVLLFDVSMAVQLTVETPIVTDVSAAI